MLICAIGLVRRGRNNRNNEEEEESSEEEEEEESEEEESEEEAPTEQQAELTRAERRELKKKQKQKPQQKDGDEEEEDDDPLLANTNRAIGKKLNISDLSAPRELTRKERYAVSIHPSISYSMLYREAKAAKEAKEKYWKVLFLTL